MRRLWSLRSAQRSFGPVLGVATMALRLLKKFDELDQKERVLTGMRRSRFSKLLSNPDRRKRPQSAGPARRRTDHISCSVKSSTRPHSAQVGRRRPPNVGKKRESKPSHRRPVSASRYRSHGRSTSPKNLPLAPEVENVFGSKVQDSEHEETDAMDVGRSYERPGTTRTITVRQRPASAGALRVRSDQFGGQQDHRSQNIRTGWDRRSLQRGARRRTPGSIGESRAAISHRIIQPQFYFLRVNMKGIVTAPETKCFDVQITDLTSEDRHTHWYTDISVDRSGHLVFRPGELVGVKSSKSTRTVISPIHDFPWVTSILQMYGHAIRIEVFSQDGLYQTLLLDRCAYYGKFDPSIVALAQARVAQPLSPEEQVANASGVGLKKKNVRPTTAPASRIRRDVSPIRSPKQQPAAADRLGSTSPNNGNYGFFSPSAGNVRPPRLAGPGSLKEQKQRVDSPPNSETPQELLITTFKDQSPSSTGPHAKVKVDVPMSPHFGGAPMTSPNIGVSGWMPERAREDVKLEVEGFEALTQYRKQIIEKMKFTQAEAASRDRPRAPLKLPHATVRLSTE